MSFARTGDFGTTSLAEVLIALYRSRASGTLRLERDRTQKSVVLADGAPVAVRTNVASERTAARLLAADRIDKGQAERLDAAVDAECANEAAALAALRIFESKAVLELLRDFTRARLLPVFAWTNGGYAFDEADADPQKAPLRVDPIRLVQHGIASHWTPESVLGDLASLASEVASPNDTLPALLKRLDRSGALDALLAGLRGETRFDVLLGRAARDPKALAGAWVLVRCEALAFRPLDETKPDEAIDDALGDYGSEIEISIEGDAAAARGAAGPSAGAAKSRSAGGDADELRAEIEERYAALGNATHYEVLGVDDDAPAPKIKKAYFKLAKRFHPDKLGGLGLDDVAERAEALISRINEAHSVLSDEQARKEYDAAGEAGDVPEIDIQRVAQAESFFVKGEVLFKMGDYRNALPLLENAVDVWPDECAYQATLGWALFKKAPPEKERALEHLSRAVELDPDAAQVYQWLGLVQRSLGQTQAANESLLRARTLDPSLG